MTDIWSKEKRSEVMRAIHSSGNKSTELSLIAIFRDSGVSGWRRNYKLLGKPDFVFPKAKLVVFVDGCFWHGHTCLKHRPNQNRAFWNEKIDRNQRRDKRVTRELRNLGWHVVRIWECELEKNHYGRKLRLIQKHLQEADSPPAK